MHLQELHTTSSAFLSLAKLLLKSRYEFSATLLSDHGPRMSLELLEEAIDEAIEALENTLAQNVIISSHSIS